MAERNPTPGAPAPARTLADRVERIREQQAARNAARRVMVDNAAIAQDIRMALQQYGEAAQFNPTFTGAMRGTPDDPLGQRERLAARHCNAVERDGRWIGTYSGYPIDMPTHLDASDQRSLHYGLGYFAGKWIDAIEHLKLAGLQDDELRGSMAILQPRLAATATAKIQRHEVDVAADRKARALLVMCLNNAQREDFEKHERFAIAVQHDLQDFPTGKFQISKAASFNVMHVESQERFCVTAVDCPIYDQMLTQKLLLEQDPETFFKTANRAGAGRGLDDAGDARPLWQLYVDPAAPEPPATQELNRTWTHAAVDAEHPGWSVVEEARREGYL